MCLQRGASQPTISSCEAYGSSSNCLKCISTFSLNQQGTCDPVAPTVANCIEYRDGVCKYCSSNSYYNAATNQCTPITPPAVAQCAAYSAPTICDRCNINYFLSGN